MVEEFFPNEISTFPRIYAYRDKNTEYDGLLKVGYTTRSVEERVAEQYPTLRPGDLPYEIVLDDSAMRNNGTAFTDKEVHRVLKESGIENPGGEWFRCNLETVQDAVNAVRGGNIRLTGRNLNFVMRPEQKAAVEKTARYFVSEKSNKDVGPSHFLWNAKMRFGKTFAAYQLAKSMKWNKVLVLTFKPAVQNAWEEDLLRHEDFEDWQFIASKQPGVHLIDENKPIVCFGSFQDYLGKNKAGGIKSKNEWVHATHWDCVILDEYHYGSWRETAKELFETEDSSEQKTAEGEGISYFDEDIMPITTEHYLYLSGTPFRAIESGEFIEEQIFNWTYTDEQQAKLENKGKNDLYESLPQMVLMTYQLPDSIRDVALSDEFDGFDLSTFFSAEGERTEAKFTFENEVQKWLDLIRGAHLETLVDDLKLGAKKPPFPYSDVRLLKILNHSFWFLPSVASCYAMRNLLLQDHNKFYHDYTVIVAAGSEAGLGVAALDPVRSAMADPLKTKTITLSCGKLTTGVSVKPWSAIFMLRNLSSPETYFQAAFRVQTPWVVKNEDGVSPNKETILKEKCYVFDFAPNRALRQISDYSCRLKVEETNPEKKVEDFINFLPVLAYDGSYMKQIDAAGVLDIALSGTSATLLARRWESALLVNVDNSTLEKLLNSRAAMDALAKIEGFRSLNQEIKTILNRSEEIKSLKEKANDAAPSKKDKKALSDAEKEFQSKRKEIQKKLIKFATRIPIFMYLTDYREKCLNDVITKIEPGLFRKVTGLEVEDFELLVGLNIFNSALMNDAVYKFKRYEDASLNYTGIDKTEGQSVGLYDTVITSEEFLSDQLS